MKTIIKRTAIALLFGLLPAGALSAQVTVTTPPAGGGGVNVQAGAANVQTGPGGGTNVVVPPGTAAAIENNAAARQENRIERREDRQAVRGMNNDWRMRRYNNRWWYWNPNNSWSYHNGTRWVPFRAARQYTAAQPAPARRYSSGYRGPITNPAPNATPSTNANVLPGTPQLPANTLPGGGPAPSDR